MLLLFVTVVTVVQRPASRKRQKTRVKPENTPGFSRYFRVLPALDAGDRRGSLPGLPYCCSAGLTLATVVGEPHCCSVVTVNTSNTVQLLTFDSSTSGLRSWVVTAEARAVALCAQGRPVRGKVGRSAAAAQGDSSFLSLARSPNHHASGIQGGGESGSPHERAHLRELTRGSRQKKEIRSSFLPALSKIPHS